MSGVYAQDGVDFKKERTVVAVFTKLCNTTRGFTKDLEEYGIYAPDKIGYFSDGVEIDPAKLKEKTGDRRIGLVYGMDGAGTKPRAYLAYLKSERSKNSEFAETSKICVGIDTIAMVANDLICGGARPMHILDYIAWEDPDIKVAQDLAAGFYEGARQAGATFIGGENASLSEMIRGHDVCASASGVVLNLRYMKDPKTGEGNPLTGERIEIGDAIIGIGSSGVHCNGISTLRKKLVLLPDFGWKGAYLIDEVVPELGKTALEEILTPTIIYKEPVLDGVLGDDQFDVKAIVNVTGEGVYNLMRALSEKKGAGALLDLTKEEKLRPQPVFRLVQKHGEISDREMWEVYNMGIGMQMIVPRDQAEAVVERLEEFTVGDVPIRASVVGGIVEDGEHRVHLKTPEFEDVYKPPEFEDVYKPAS